MMRKNVLFFDEFFILFCSVRLISKIHPGTTIPAANNRWISDDKPKLDLSCQICYEDSGSDSFVCQPCFNATSSGGKKGEDGAADEPICNGPRTSI